MEFVYITDISAVTELQVLVMIYNLLLTFFIYHIAFNGFKYIVNILRKGVYFK